MDRLIQLQENLFEYFKDVDDKTFVEFVDAFAYKTPSNNPKVSKLGEKFIEDNGLFEALAAERYDDERPDRIFNRSSLSQIGMLQDIRVSLVSISHNRFRRFLNKKSNPNVVNVKRFNYVKRHLLECYESLNRSESYFYGEKEDARFVKKIEKLELNN